MRKYKVPMLALAAVGLACLFTTDAEAFHHRRWGCGGCWGYSAGCYGCSGGYWGCSGGCWGSSGGSWGCSGGYYRVHRRHGCSGGYYGCSGGYYGCSGGYGCWGSSGGCSGGCWGSSGTVIYSDGYYEQEANPPAAPTEPTPPQPADAADGKSAFIGSGLLLVTVPADAKVRVNGKETTSSGTERQYISRGLVQGAHYNFEVTATTIRDGQPVTVTKTATLTAGGNVHVAFDDLADAPADAVAAEPMTTKLTVRVPADAKVYLAGNETRQTGEVREFSTTKLAPGEGWNGYTVRAEFEQDGKLVTREQVVSLAAGQSKEISFDFADHAGDVAIATTAQK